jgi:hypothetical protein
MKLTHILPVIWRSKFYLFLPKRSEENLVNLDFIATLIVNLTGKTTILAGGVILSISFLQNLKTVKQT